MVCKCLFQELALSWLSYIVFCSVSFVTEPISFSFQLVHLYFFAKMKIKMGYITNTELNISRTPISGSEMSLFHLLPKAPSAFPITTL